jgi:VWFA-related protein
MPIFAAAYRREDGHRILPATSPAILCCNKHAPGEKMPRSLLLPLALCLAASAQSPTSQPIPTLKARTQLVIVDVVVTDSHQNPIHNLKAADFTLLENKDPQQIKNFEEHTTLSTTKLQPMPAMPPGIFTNWSPTPVNSAVNILLLDTLNTPLQDQSFVHDQLKQYLKSSQPGARIAIFGLTTHLNLLQGFTSNPELLKTAINIKSLQTSPLLDDPVGGGAGLQPLSDTVSSFGNAPDMANTLANLKQFEAEQQSFQLQLRARYTLDALNQLARYLAGIPGRKNLIWFSGSFPINILPDADLQDPFAAAAGFEDEFRETTNLLTLNQVAVYPVDARGLMVSPSFSAANSGSQYGRDRSAASKEEAKFFQQTAAEHATMLKMAEQTGGKAFINTNGLSQAVATAIDAGSNYYTLAYSPTNTKWNGSFRKIKVNLQQQGYTLSYRRGYYADDPEASTKHYGATATTPATKPVDPMHAAMMRGGPDPTQIILKVRVLPTSTTAEDKPAEGNVLNPHLKIQGPYRRYDIDYAADSRATITQTSDGIYHLDVQFLTYVYDQDGNLINYADNNAHAKLSPETYAGLLQRGLPYHQEISVPVKGQYYLRIGIHDLNADRVGALEIPVASVKDLTPLPAPNPSAPAPAPSK